MTENTASFIAANVQSPVIAGQALGPPRFPTGVRYSLKDGRTFTLSSAELVDVLMPRWDFSNVPGA